MKRRAPGFTLLEIVTTLAVVTLVATLVVPRPPRTELLRARLAARQLADALTLTRERSVLGGMRLRLVVEEKNGRWTIGRPGLRPATIDAAVAPLAGPHTLPAEVALRSIVVGTVPLPIASSVALDFDPTGSALPIRLDLAGPRGWEAQIELPPGTLPARLVERQP